MVGKTKKASEVAVLGKGDYYKNDASGEKVCIFYVGRDEVAYAPVGSSAEFRTNHQQFLDTFTKTTATA